MGDLLAISALLMFSTNVLTVKVASERLNSAFGFLVAVSVNVVFALLLWGTQALFLQEAFQWDSLGFLLFLLAGFFSTCLGRFFFYDAIAKLGPAKASTFQVSNPLFTVLIAWIFLGENLTRVDIVAISAILLGLFMVNYDPRTFSTQGHAATGKEDLLKEDPQVEEISALKRLDLRVVVGSGAFLALSSAAAYAVGNVLRGVAVQEWNEPILGALLGAMVGMALHFFFNSRARHFWSQLKTANRTGLLLFAFSGALTISAQICVIASMWYIPVAVANLIALSTPVLVTPVSYFLLKNQERITLLTILGIAMVLSGIGTVTLV